MNPVAQPDRIDFSLTPRQRRYRAATAVLLVIIIAMIVYGRTSPFFRVGSHRVLTPLAVKALKAKAIFLFGYWSVCLILAFFLVLIAWLEIREIRRKANAVRRDFAREIAERKQGQSGPPSTV